VGVYFDWFVQPEGQQGTGVDRAQRSKMYLLWGENVAMFDVNVDDVAKFGS